MAQHNKRVHEDSENYESDSNAPAPKISRTEADLETNDEVEVMHCSNHVSGAPGDELEAKVSPKEAEFKSETESSAPLGQLNKWNIVSDICELQWPSGKITDADDDCAIPIRLESLGLLQGICPSRAPNSV